MLLSVEGARRPRRATEIGSAKKWQEYRMKYRAITFASATFFVSSLVLASDTWILDSSRSTARLFQGSQSVNTGVARVTGKVKLDTNDLDHSFFDLSIYPADEESGHPLTREGALPIGYVPGGTDQTLLTFKSTRILRTRNGELEVIGDLTLTRVERPTIATRTEGYAGPVYGDPVIRNETREITFLFPSTSVAHISGPLSPAMLRKESVLEIVGSARVDRDEFSELLTAIKETNWPAVVQNEDCHMHLQSERTTAEFHAPERWSQQLAITTVMCPPPQEKITAGSMHSGDRQPNNDCFGPKVPPPSPERSVEITLESGETR